VLTSAASDRPIRLRKRPDLVVAEQWFGCRQFFVLKDPLRLAYSYLTQQEYFILSLLDGEQSSAAIEAAFASRFAPQQITAGQLQGFAAQLHRTGLVLSESPGQGRELALRDAERSQWNSWRLVEKSIALRWRGMDPEPVLRWLDPKIGWMFSYFGLAVWLVVVTAGILQLLTHSNELARRAPDTAAWLAADKLPWLAIALILVKTLHELGHGLAARRMGCRSREMGLQLFLFLPCLYTDVSDTWLLPSKWRRIVVSAAGMYVEIFLAALAAMIWSLAEPGMLSSLCQSVLLVASVGTLALNGNPLLRYDGYHILSDLWEIPNLERRSQAQLVHALAWWGLGVDWWPADELDRKPRPLLAIFALASLTYRVVVLAGVYWVMTTMLRPVGLEPAASLFAGLAVLGIVFPVAALLGQLIVRMRSTNELNYSRLAASAFLALALFLAGLYVPLPQWITVPVVIEPRDASRIYATVAGELREAVPAGADVQAGQVVARLENLTLRRDLARLETEKRRQDLLLFELETIRGEDAAAAAGIPAAREAVADLQLRISQLNDLIGQLTLVAPHDGIILPPPNRRTAISSRELQTWSGTPLDIANRGAAVESGTLVGLVARRGDLEAIAVVDQADAPLIQPGHTVYLKIDQQASRTLRGKIEHVARADSEELPLHLAATGSVPQGRDAAQNLRPLATVYRVRVTFDETPDGLLPGAMGHARIVGVAEPLAKRMGRWLARTFRFRS